MYDLGELDCCYTCHDTILTLYRAIKNTILFELSIFFNTFKMKGQKKDDYFHLE